jgi:hypothetical protein
MKRGGLYGYNLIYTDSRDPNILIAWRIKREEKMGAGIAGPREGMAWDENLKVAGYY